MTSCNSNSLIRYSAVCLLTSRNTTTRSCLFANSLFIISLVALHSWLEPNKTFVSGQRCESSMNRRQRITLTHQPFHNHLKVISGLGQRSQVVQMKRPSMKRGGHFPREAELTVSNKRHDRDEIGSPESISEKGGGGKWRDGKRVKAWQRLAEKDKWDHERGKRDRFECRFMAGREDRDDGRRRGDIIKVENLIHGLLLITRVVITPSLRVNPFLP